MEILAFVCRVRRDGALSNPTRVIEDVRQGRGQVVSQPMKQAKTNLRNSGKWNSKPVILFARIQEMCFFQDHIMHEVRYHCFHKKLEFKKK